MNRFIENKTEFTHTYHLLIQNLGGKETSLRKDDEWRKWKIKSQQLFWQSDVLCGEQHWFPVFPKDMEPCNEDFSKKEDCPNMMQHVMI